MIQNIITRMGSNLFLLKGRAVTLIVWIFAIISNEINYIYMLFSFGILVIFWLLDWFFLSMERCFRWLYDAVRIKDEKEIDFSMNIKPYMKWKNTWIKSMFSKTLLIFYGILFIMISIIFLSKINIEININLDPQDESYISTNRETNNQL